MDAHPEFPYLFAVLELWFAEGTAFVLVPPLTHQGRGAAYFLRAYAGAPVTRTLRPSSLRIGERPG